jgi:hypothetical protein
MNQVKIFLRAASEPVKNSPDCAAGQDGPVSRLIESQPRENPLGFTLPWGFFIFGSDRSNSLALGQPYIRALAKEFLDGVFATFLVLEQMMLHTGDLDVGEGHLRGYLTEILPFFCRFRGQKQENAPSSQRRCGRSCTSRRISGRKGPDRGRSASFYWSSGCGRYATGHHPRQLSPLIAFSALGTFWGSYLPQGSLEERRCLQDSYFQKEQAVLQVKAAQRQKMHPRSTNTAVLDRNLRVLIKGGCLSLGDSVIQTFPHNTDALRSDGTANRNAVEKCSCRGVRRAQNAIHATLGRSLHFSET